MAKGTKGGGLTTSVSKAIKSSKPTGEFNLEAFKAGKNLSSTNVKFKEDTWIPLSPAFQEVLQLPGILKGHVNMFRGHSDTGKTTAMLEAAVSCQKAGILPVLIITEMKWSWAHARQMGFEFKEVADETTGEVTGHEGFFIYVDRESLSSIEAVGAFITDLMDEQGKGNIPHELCFLWDSVGSIPCEKSINSKGGNAQWNAASLSEVFGNYVNQRITLSRKESQKYTNTLVIVNKVWVRIAEGYGERPKLENKGGNAMFSDATLVFTFGGISHAGTNKIVATKNGKTVEFAKRVRASCDKNHHNGITSNGKVLATVHGFIMDDKADGGKDMKAYSAAHRSEWLSALGSDDFDVVEEADSNDGDSNNYSEN